MCSFDLEEEEAVLGPSRRPNSFRSAPPGPPLLVVLVLRFSSIGESPPLLLLPLLLPMGMLPLACQKKKKRRALVFELGHIMLTCSSHVLT